MNCLYYRDRKFTSNEKVKMDYSKVSHLGSTPLPCKVTPLAPLYERGDEKNLWDVRQWIFRFVRPAEGKTGPSL